MSVTKHGSYNAVIAIRHPLGLIDLRVVNDSSAGVHLYSSCIRIDSIQHPKHCAAPARR